MNPLIVLATLAVLIASILTYNVLYPKCTCKEERPLLIRDLPQAIAILKTSTLLSRATPNQRLVRAFLISNAFTTTDQVFYKDFLTAAKSLLKTSDESLATISREFHSLAERMSSLLDNRPAYLNSLIQVFCFRFVLRKFFASAYLELCSCSILHITRLINSLWISSKCSCLLSSSQISMQYSLYRELGLLFSLPGNDEIGNSLNILLPAYETLWRVVLRCFLEVSFRPQSDVTSEWENVFAKFLTNPTKKQFSERRGSCSVQDIVYESLRLYPPTKRIYRQDQGNGAIVAIDVEHIQRAEEIWGMDGSDFRPERWSELNSGRSTAYKEAWMPFGKGTFQCPALKVAPMMIGILVGCLVDTFGRERWILEGKGVEKEVLGGGPLDNGREAFRGLFLRRVKTSQDE